MESDFFSLGDYVKGSSFGIDGGAKEYYLTIDSKEDVSFIHELNNIYDTYRMAMKECDLSAETLVFSRFYISDIANQKDILRDHPIFQELSKASAVSVIQQCPVYGGDVNLLMYHVRPNGNSLKKAIFNYDDENRRNGAVIHGKYYDLLWVANFYGTGPFDSHVQTSEIFESFNNILEKNGMTLLDNAVRTWVYVRDVDNHYKGMVEARKAFFEEHGLTPETRYIASTGIEGFSKEVNSLVAFDACAIKNLKPEQIVRMEALENLSPTIKYGVTFERGTRIRYGDRSHLHISGTASIDKEGKILHLHDVKKQTIRTLENVNALLSPHGAGLKDMAYIIGYVRNLKDRRKVMEVLKNEVPANIPLLLLEGAVCRPAWLVELEGVAIISDNTEFSPFL